MQSIIQRDIVFFQECVNLKSVDSKHLPDLAMRQLARPIFFQCRRLKNLPLKISSVSRNYLRYVLWNADRNFRIQIVFQPLANINQDASGFCGF